MVENQYEDVWSGARKNRELPWNVCIVDHLSNMRKTTKERLYQMIKEDLD